MLQHIIFYRLQDSYDKICEHYAFYATVMNDTLLLWIFWCLKYFHSFSNFLVTLVVFNFVWGMIFSKRLFQVLLEMLLHEKVVHSLNVFGSIEEFHI